MGGFQRDVEPAQQQQQADREEDFEVPRYDFLQDRSKDKGKKDDMAYTAPERERPGSSAPGSLWGRKGEGSLYTDNTARKVGDVVTIALDEQMDGSLSADTNAERTAEYNAGIPNLMGYENAMGDLFSYGAVSRLLGFDLPGQNQEDDFDPANAIEANTENSLEGSGTANRSGELSGMLTAVVTKVYSNGYLRIKGRKAVTVNEEVQYLQVTGVVRPEDVNRDNVVPSSRIANARMGYVGDGVLARQQDEGWFPKKVMHDKWPF
jgi:flagellar L-ring protein precursor FlgH